MIASTDRTVLVTGATGGIGRAAAKHFAERGARVFATGRKPELLEELEKEVGDPLRLRGLLLDVTRSDSIEEAAAQVHELTSGAGIDVLVNNAGYGLVGPLLDITDERLRAQFDTNVFGLMAVTRAFVPAMIRRGSGRIVNVGSVAGRVSMPFLGAYNASKYAVEALSDALRMELHPFGLRVSIIEPGPIRTSFGATSLGTVRALDASRSFYAPVLADAEKIHAGAERFNFPVEVVVRVIHEAALGDSPRPRYVVPGFMSALIGASALAPTRLVDAILRRALGLDTAKIQKALRARGAA